MVCLTASHTAPGLADGHFLTPSYPHFLRQPSDCLPLSFGPGQVQIKHTYIYIQHILINILMSQEALAPSLRPAG